MKKCRLRYDTSINHYDLHNLSPQYKYCTVKLKTLSWKSDFGCLTLCGPGGFRVMFVFRLNSNAELRFMGNSL